MNTINFAMLISVKYIPEQNDLSRIYIYRHENIFTNVVIQILLCKKELKLTKNYVTTK